MSDWDGLGLFAKIVDWTLKGVFGFVVGLVVLGFVLWGMGVI